MTRQARYGGPEGDSKRNGAAVAAEHVADFEVTVDREDNDPLPTMRRLWAQFKATRNSKPFDDYALYLVDGVTDGRVLPENLTTPGYSQGVVNGMIQSAMHGQKIPA